MKPSFPLSLSDIDIILEMAALMNPQRNFKLTISGTGKVRLEPLEYSRIQPVTSQIKPEVVKDLLEAAMEIGFFEMAAEYDNESILSVTEKGFIKQEKWAIFDGVNQSFTIRLGKKSKSVRAYYGYPKRLDWFYRLILKNCGIESLR
ncbi:MAG: hypothetical protein K9N35_05650 [Candidatus Marinimicrobia bacterium]|nr:hypothetical protein [Candidatus Neomarinimicrobiota bacterium]